MMLLKKDVEKISTPFRIRLNPNAQLLRQCSSKVPIIIIETKRMPFSKNLKNTTILNKSVLLLKSVLTSISSGEKLFAFISSFYGLKGFSNFFIEQMFSFFKTLTDQGSALAYINDILLLSNSKEYMFQLIEQLHIINTKHNLKLAPEKFFTQNLSYAWKKSLCC